MQPTKRLNETVLFSDTFVRQCDVPTEGERRYYDQEISKLMLVVRPSGKKTFRVRKRLGTRVLDITLGRFPDISVKGARKLARDTLEGIAQGINVNEKKREDRQKMKFKDVFELMVQEDMEGKLSEDYVKQVKHDFNNGIYEEFEKLTLEQITRADVKIFYERHSKRAKVRAGQLVKVIQRVFRFAIDYDIYQGVNPLMRFKMINPQRRRRFIRKDEWTRLKPVILDSRWGDFFMLALQTGARSINLKKMRWDQIDWDNEIWIVPNAKNKQFLSIPLIPDALEILRRRQQQSESEWVFPAANKQTYFKTFDLAWKRICQEAAIDGLTIHDLRRSCASYQVMSGVSLKSVATSLGHANTQTTESNYAFLQADVVRDGMMRGWNTLQTI